MKTLKVGAAAVLAASILLMSCVTAAPVYHAYEGAPGDERKLSHVILVSDSLFDIILYRVNGKPRLTEKRGLVEGTFSDEASGGFDIAVLPGPQVFEFHNVHKTPFDMTPLEYRALQFTTEAGKSYYFVKQDKTYIITLDGKPIPISDKPVGILSEPGANEPHAKLEFHRQNSPGDTLVWVFRIDGLIRQNMNRYEPRWVIMNTKAVGGAFNPSEAELSLRLSPGAHTIEYVTDRSIVIGREASNQVKRAEFTVEAGKTYQIVVVPGKSSDKDDSSITFKAE
jgi:hypothetical protein